MTLLSIGAAAAEDPGKSGAHVAEIVQFRLAPGVTDADFLAAAKASLVHISAAEGYVGRTLSRNPDGLWTDHVLWTDLALAQSAMETVSLVPEVQPFLMAIDPASISVSHGEIFPLD